MRKDRALTLLALALVGSTTALLVACDDEAATTASDGGVDAGSSPPDAAPAGDAAKADASPDAAPEDAGDAGPTVTTSVGSTGYIRLFPDAVFADFQEDDTIVRLSNAPECVIHVRSQTKPFSPAGTLTIGGPVVGADGGPDAIITLDPTPNNNYELVDAVVFPTSETFLVQLEGTGTATFPGIPVQSFRPPPATSVTVTKPLPPTGPELDVSSTTALEVEWTVPTGLPQDLRMAVSLTNLIGSLPKQGAIYCGYPLSAGKATIPVNALAELKARVGAGADATGFMQILAGGQEEFASGGASYTFEVSRFDSTTMPATSIKLK